ncbi:hypothetical protein B0T11DRAFT_284085 [Plectosphaerella cucumerina]|uniref:Uncharacterized protein n=1 Tax=Plectosphaerella cucumerina TaxID=40658 RepID=A0A8K0TGY7_9PEZI|nr:hypothetical protein B0T11DRAFT_284085 [Plectosphaerella cucumerina]
MSSGTGSGEGRDYPGRTGSQHDHRHGVSWEGTNHTECELRGRHEQAGPSLCRHESHLLHRQQNDILPRTVSPASRSLLVTSPCSSVLDTLVRISASSDRSKKQRGTSGISPALRSAQAQPSPLFCPSVACRVPRFLSATQGSRMSDQEPPSTSIQVQFPTPTAAAGFPNYDPVLQGCTPHFPCAGITAAARNETTVWTENSTLTRSMWTTRRRPSDRHNMLIPRHLHPPCAREGCVPDSWVLRGASDSFPPELPLSIGAKRRVV